MQINPDNKISIISPNDQITARGARRTPAASETGGSDAASLVSPAETRFRAVDKTIRETLDGLSLFRVADEASEKIEEALLRMKDIASRGEDASLSAEDRKNLQFEIDDLRDLVDFVGKNASYDNGPIFGDDPSAAKLWADTASRLDASLPHADNGRVAGMAAGTADLGLGGLDVRSAEGSSDAVARLDTAVANVSGNRAMFASGISRLGEAARNMAAGAVNILSAQTGVADIDGARGALESAKRSIFATPSFVLAAHTARSGEDVLSLAE